MPVSNTASNKIKLFFIPMLLFLIIFPERLHGAAAALFPTPPVAASGPLGTPK
jgi:hypothetical protein